MEEQSKRLREHCVILCINRDEYNYYNMLINETHIRRKTYIIHNIIIIVIEQRNVSCTKFDIFYLVLICEFTIL